jgi:hypothetical protein
MPNVSRRILVPSEIDTELALRSGASGVDLRTAKYTLEALFRKLCLMN